MPEPRQNPGRSKQDYETPPELIAAVARRFGQLHVDLAARADNAKAPRFVTPQDDSLRLNWRVSFPGLICWLNPPFADIAPWARKCNEATSHGGLTIIMLTPASVGANWFAEHVHGRAEVLALSPRLTFVGAPAPYPKDCMLSIFGRVEHRPRFDVWRWA